VRENIHKSVPNQNFWMIELSKDPSTNGVVETQVYDAEAIMADIKNALVSRGSMTIRGLGRVFKAIDDNRNRQIDVTELMYGLKDFGVHLNQEQAKSLLARFDRDNSGSVSFDEFIRVLRGDLSPSRIGMIRQAYDKLDVNKDGSVTLDDVARLYDVSQNPDVISKKLTPEQAYK